MEVSMQKTYFQLRSRFGVLRATTNTDTLADLISLLKKIKVPFGLYKSDNIKGPWERVEDIYDVEE